MFNASHLSFFERSCKHYLKILEDSLSELISHNGSFYPRIAELGVGTGSLTSLMQNRIEFDHFDAIDIDESLISCALERSANAHKIEFRAIDALEFLKRSNERFDLIVSSFLIHNLSNEYKIKLFTAISEKLTEDGIFLLIDKIGEKKTTDFNSLAMQFDEFFEYFKERAPMDQKALEFWIRHYVEDEEEFKRYYEDSLESMAVEAQLHIKSWIVF